MRSSRRSFTAKSVHRLSVDQGGGRVRRLRLIPRQPGVLVPSQCCEANATLGTRFAVGRSVRRKFSRLDVTFLGAARQDRITIDNGEDNMNCSAKHVRAVAIGSLVWSLLALWGAHADDRPPLVVQEQGSFYYGGRTYTAPGDFNPADLIGGKGETFEIDKGYAFYQIPPNPRRLPIVLWHGGGQTGKSFESYQAILVRRGWSVYNIDEPRRGKSGFASFTGPLGLLLGEKVGPMATIRYGMKASFTVFRLGDWGPNGPSYFPGVQFPKTKEALEQLTAGAIPFYNEDFDFAHTGTLQAPLFEKIGPTILITHSMAGGPGWVAAMTSPNVKAVIAYEPGTTANEFVFPEGTPHPEGAMIVPMSEFMKLTKIPIQIYYGDFIPKSGGNAWQQKWRSAVNEAHRFADTVNRYGGDVQITELPDVGLKGNTHFPFADLNNEQVADVLGQYLHAKDLDKRDGGK
jgi:hypothetical protein